MFRVVVVILLDANVCCCEDIYVAYMSAVVAMTVNEFQVVLWDRAT